MRSNFVIYTDSNGSLPVLRPIGVPLSLSFAKHHKYWVEYRNNKPVAVKPYPFQTSVWDYSVQESVSISSIKEIR